MTTQTETARQFLFIEKAKEHVDELAKKLGRRPLCNVTTFGCQMNLVAEKVKTYRLINF